MVDDKQRCSSISEDELSHKDALLLTKKHLEELVKDPLLNDIPNDVLSAEIKAKIDFEKGRAFQVYLKRTGDDGFEFIPLIVTQKTTVFQLKKKIHRVLGRKIKDESGQSCLSWKYFWRTYWLVHNNEKLSDDLKTLQSYGVKDKSEITFLKKLRRK